MGECIIDPMVFYWIGVLDCLGYVMSFIFLGATILVIGLAVYAVTKFIEGEKENKRLTNMIKKSIISLIIIGLVGSFIPTEKTMYTMLISKQVTKENINATTDTIKSTVDYIFDKLDKEEE